MSWDIEFPPLLYRVCLLHKIWLSFQWLLCMHIGALFSSALPYFHYLILSSLSFLFPLLLIVVMIHIPTGWVGSCDSKLSPEKGFCSFPVTSVTCTERRHSGISRRSRSSSLRPKRNSLEKWADFPPQDSAQSFTQNSVGSSVGTHSWEECITVGH